MLAHLKAKQRETMSPKSDMNGKTSPPAPESSVPSQARSHPMTEEENSAQQITCDVLCSLGSSSPQPCNVPLDDSPTSANVPVANGSTKGRKGSKACPKQHQLPMFLSKTYHMIDRCDPAIATWSVSGDNFVVKNVEKFAGSVLPQYFKHSNFSSFARQLNFYGFRKLKAEPILTADFDARTACYVRFYHEKFQKDRPELLAQIKRATKSDQQSKDDVDSLRMEICKLKECVSNMAAEHDRKIAEIHFEYNRRINTLSSDYDKLTVLVQQIMTGHVDGKLVAHASKQAPDMMHSLSQVAAYSLQTLRPPAVQPTASASGVKRPAEDEKLPPASRARKS